MTALARQSDPLSSHLANHRIAHNAPLREHILAAARRLDPAPFDDWDLLELVEASTGQRQQRNVIARTRGLMEDTNFVRVGLLPSRHGSIDTLHFRLPGANEQLTLLPGGSHGSG